jgi:hypothetical protein
MRRVYLYLMIGLLAIIPASAFGLGIGDFFSGIGVNYQLWNDVSHNGGSASIDNGALSLATTAGTRWGRGQLSSMFNLVGNFDAAVDFNLTKFDDIFSSAVFGVWATDGSFGMITGRMYTLGGTQNYETDYHINNNWATGYGAQTGDFSGKFRFQRVGSNLNSYIFTGGDWLLTSSIILPTSASVRVFMEAGNDGDAGNAPEVIALYDNFFAHADDIVGVDPSYTVANPEPATLLLFGSGILGAGALARFRRKK